MRETFQKVAIETKRYPAPNVRPAHPSWNIFVHYTQFNSRSYQNLPIKLPLWSLATGVCIYDTFIVFGIRQLITRKYWLAFQYFTRKLFTTLQCWLLILIVLGNVSANQTLCHQSSNIVMNVDTRYINFWEDLHFILLNSN